jgi:hypothetical protein
MTGAQAKSEYEHLMSIKNERKSILQEFLSTNGVSLACDDTALGEIESWFVSSVESDTHDTERLRPLWYSVVRDLALFLGDCMIERHGHLHWAYYKWGKKSRSFQRPVIMGFKNVQYGKYHMDIDDMLAIYGVRTVYDKHRENLHRFVGWMRVANEFA